MIRDNQKTLAPVLEYYKKTFMDFGATPKGVDWNGEESQFLRFERLLRNIQFTTGDSILDFGCGYGSLTNLLKAKDLELNYFGYDAVPDMLRDIQIHPSKLSEIYFSDSDKLSTYDWIVASGVFNVKREVPIEEWEGYIIDTIRHLESIAKKGLVFNMLSLSSDENRRRDYLYYSSPYKLLEKTGISVQREIFIDHDYPLWEFTVTIRR